MRKKLKILLAVSAVEIAVALVLIAVFSSSLLHAVKWESNKDSGLMRAVSTCSKTDFSAEINARIDELSPTLTENEEGPRLDAMYSSSVIFNSKDISVVRINTKYLALTQDAQTPNAGSEEYLGEETFDFYIYIDAKAPKALPPCRTFGAFLMERPVCFHKIKGAIFCVRFLHGANSSRTQIPKAQLFPCAFFFKAV